MNAKAIGQVGKISRPLTAIILLAPVLLAASQPAFGQQLFPGNPRVVSAGIHTHSHFFIDVPNHTQRLVITLSGGWGNGNLYAKRNPPAVGVWTHHSTHPTNHDRIEIHNPQPGRWWVLVFGAGAYHNATLVADYHVQNNGGILHAASTFGPILGEALGHLANRPHHDDDDDDDRDEPDPQEVKLIPLKSGVQVKGLRSRDDRIDYYRMEVPSGTMRVSFESSGGKGECVLIVRRDNLPTLEENDYCSAEPGTCQVVTIDTPRDGVYYARLVEATRFKGVSLTATCRKAPPRKVSVPGARRILLVSPREASTVAAGEVVDITWIAPARVKTVMIEVSSDGGASWSLVASLPAEAPKFVWFVSRETIGDAGSLLLRVCDQADPSNAKVRRLAASG